jgi:hypothetical protein
VTWVTRTPERTQPPFRRPRCIGPPAFLGVFAKADHPLVLFLDDPQWADAASLQLITRWMIDGDNRYLFTLGAYRD